MSKHNFCWVGNEEVEKNMQSFILLREQRGYHADLFIHSLLASSQHFKR